MKGRCQEISFDFGSSPSDMQWKDPELKVRRLTKSITEGRAPDEVYAEVRKEFGEEELVNLSLAIITINGWNRLAIGFRKIPGEYQPHKIG